MRLRIVVVATLLVAFSPKEAFPNPQSGVGVTSGGELAGLQESFKTDQFTGAATHSIALVVPPGSNGVQPALSLEYSSQRGTTWIGRGWDLSVPFIERMTKFGKPAYDDDPSDPASDLFALGDDRLVRDKNGRYRAMREDFSRIERVDQGNGKVDYWVLHATDGTRLWFGNTAGTRLLNGSNRFRWLLHRVEDAHGNYIEYTYTSQVPPGTKYLDKIEYGYSGEPAATRSITFVTENRPDVTTIFTGGFRRDLTQRLSSVEVQAGGSIATTYDLIYKDEVAATPPNGQSLLHKVVRAGVGGVTLPADVYHYTGTDEPTWARDSGLEGRLDAIGVDLGESYAPRKAWALVDVNGDAAPDLVGSQTSGSFPALPDNPASNFFSGLMGNSVYVNRKPGSHGDELYPAAGTQQYNITNPPPPQKLYDLPVPLFSWPVTGGASAPGVARPRLVDYNGDGLIDVIYSYRYWSGSPLTVRKGRLAFRNENGNWVQETVPGYKTPPGFADQWVDNGFFCIGVRVGEQQFHDVNGDGLPDIVHWYNPFAANNAGCPITGGLELRVYLNTGSGWVQDPTWSQSFSDISPNNVEGPFGRMPFFDANGDGLVDVGFDDNQDGAMNTSQPRLNNGSGWVTAGFPNPVKFRPGDLDGDGLADNIDASDGPLELNRGKDYVPAGFGPPSAAFDDLEDGSCKVFLDIDGDGIGDWINACPGGSAEIWLSREGSSPEPPAGLLERVDLGTGGTMSITYDGAGEASCYDAVEGGCHAAFLGWPENQATCVANYPLRWTQLTFPGTAACYLPVGALPFNVPLATSTTTDDGNGNISTRSFVYDGGFHDPLEREFRGFRLVSERPQDYSYTNPISGGAIDLGVLRRTRFYQFAALRGATASVELYKSDDAKFDLGQDLLLAKRVPQYAVTRGESSQTLVVEPSEATSLLCDPLLQSIEDPENPAFQGCAFRDLEDQSNQNYYGFVVPESGILFDALPMDAFHADFQDPSVLDRDKEFAYLALEIASTTLEHNGGTNVVRFGIQWHDPFGSIQATWDWSDVNDDLDDRFVRSKFATPQSPSLWNLHALPSRIEQRGVQWSGQEATFLAAPEITPSRNFFYDGQAHGSVMLGNLTTEERVLYNPITQATTSVTVVREYSAEGLLERETDAYDPLAGETERWTGLKYDPSNTFVRETNRNGTGAPLKLTTIIKYDPDGAPAGLGLVKRIMDPNGADTDFGADAFGRPTTRTGPTPVGRTVERAYNDFEGLNLATPRQVVTRSFDSGVNQVTELFADGLGRTVRTETTGLNSSDQPTEIVRSFSYNPLGQLEFRSRPGFGSAGAAGITTFTDELGRPLFIKQPNAGVFEIRYEGLTTVLIDAAGRQQDRQTNGGGELLAVTEYQGTAGTVTTTYSRDPLGRLVKVCDPQGSSCGDARHTTTFVYDTLGRRVQIQDPDRGVWDYEFDGAGRPTLQDDAEDHMVNIQYDPLGRRFTETAAGGTATFTYGDTDPTPPPNSIGRLVTVTDPTGATSLEYDSAGRPTKITKQLGGTTAYEKRNLTYDWVGRAKTVEYPDGETVTWAYDVMGVDSVSSSTGVTYVADATHNEDGRRTRLTFGNGTERVLGYQSSTGFLESLCDAAVGVCGGAGTRFLDRAYSYDPTRKLASLTDNVDSTESLSGVVYDGVGRVTSATRGGSGLAFTYDALGNLTSKEGTSLPYDHPTKPHAVYDAGDPTKYQYDLSGNMTSRDGLGLVYDLRNQVSKVTQQGSLDVDFSYDIVGSRVRKVRGAAVSEFFGTDLEILQDGVRFIKTIRADGMIVARVSTQPGAGGAGAPLGLELRQLPPFGLVLAGFVVFFMGAGMLSGTTRRVAWQRACATGLASALVLAPGFQLAIWAAEKGDANLDGKIDAGDFLVMTRHIEGSIVLDIDIGPGAEEAADVAPFLGGQIAEDSLINGADLTVIGRVVGGEDIDADGLSTRVENAIGTSPFASDSDGDGVPDSEEDQDQDGLADALEIALGLDPTLADTDGDGYVDGLDADPLSPEGDVIHWVHVDRLGGAAVVSDASANEVRRIRYGIFGEVRVNETVVGFEGTSDPSEKYTGQRFDVEVGLHFYVSRYYDSSLGSFTQPDRIIPGIGDPQNLNAYAYVRNDPLNRTDPSGAAGLVGALDRFVTKHLSCNECFLSAEDLAKAQRDFDKGLNQFINQGHKDNFFINQLAPKQLKHDLGRLAKDSAKLGPASASGSRNPFRGKSVLIGLASGFSGIGGTVGGDASAFVGVELGNEPDIVGGVTFAIDPAPVPGTQFFGLGEVFGGEVDVDTLTFLVAESADAIVAEDTIQVDFSFFVGTVRLFTGPGAELRGLQVGRGGGFGFSIVQNDQGGFVSVREVLGFERER